jgi:hypothetical protein
MKVTDKGQGLPPRLNSSFSQDKNTPATKNSTMTDDSKQYPKQIMVPAVVITAVL